MEGITSPLGRALVRPRAIPGDESIGASQGIYWCECGGPGPYPGPHSIFFLCNDLQSIF